MTSTRAGCMTPRCCSGPSTLHVPAHLRAMATPQTSQCCPTNAPSQSDDALHTDSAPEYEATCCLHETPCLHQGRLCQRCGQGEPQPHALLPRSPKPAWMEAPVSSMRRSSILSWRNKGCNLSETATELSMQAGLPQTVAAMRFILAYQSGTTGQAQGPLAEEEFLTRLHEWVASEPSSTGCATDQISPQQTLYSVSQKTWRLQEQSRLAYPGAAAIP